MGSSRPDPFFRLLDALANQLDGRIEGIALAETAIGFKDDAWPQGYSPLAYRRSVLERLQHARSVFLESRVLQCANFMPGEGLPDNDKGHLKAIYALADSIWVGVGGPDILPFRQGQQNHSLPLIRDRGPGVIAGNAVQWGNLDQINPETGEKVTATDLFAFARDTLKLDYIYWGVQEPHYSDEVLPLILGGDR